jgi:sec-independent protein translocase protein TatB
MFDLGFSELLVIGLVALVVIGPERLPKVARSAGQWLGKLNRYVSQVKQDIDRDIKLDELRKMQQDMKDAAQKYEIMADETVRRTQEEVLDTAQQLQAIGQDAASPAEGATAPAENAQISRVMQAMSATDGGLAMQEYEKIKAEQAAAASDAEESLPPSITDDSAPIHALPGVDSPATPTPDSTQPTETKVARASDDTPNGPAG